MSFLEKLRSQPQSVRVAITWGSALLLLALTIPLWLGSLKSSIDPVDAGTTTKDGSGSGAIGLFFGAVGDDIREQFGDLRDSFGSVFKGLGGAVLMEDTSVNEDASQEQQEISDNEQESLIIEERTFQAFPRR